MSTQPPGLERRLSALDAAAIVISNVIGVGIFTTPGFVAASAGHPMAILAAWAVGGLLAFAGAMAYAELATLRPRAGGEYVYLRETFGPLAAFLTGWTSFVAGFSGAIALGAVGAAEYLGRFIPAAADSTTLVAIPLKVVTFTISRRALVALVVIAALTAIHRRGLGPGRLVQNTLAGIKVTALMVFVAAGLSVGSGSLQHFAVTAPVSPQSWLGALIPVMFSYSGWNAAAYVAEEVRNPGRNVPRALAIGTGAVVVIYLGMNLLYLYALPMDRFAGVLRVGDVAAAQLLGPTAATLMSLLTIIIVCGSISAMLLAGPRVYYAMARDGVFFRSAGTIHPTFRTPSVAIIAQGLWSGVLVLSGTFDDLLNYTGFAVVLFAGVAVLALFVMRRQHPDEPRPFRAWGYPIAPAVFAAASLAIVVNGVLTRPRATGWGLAIMAAGLPIYAWLRRRRSARPPTSATLSA